MRKCRLAVSVCIMATSGTCAPTMGAMLSAAFASASTHVGNGDPERGLKWPKTPWLDHVLRCCWRRVTTRRGWGPSELPQRYTEEGDEEEEETDPSGDGGSRDSTYSKTNASWPVTYYNIMITNTMERCKGMQDDCKERRIIGLFLLFCFVLVCFVFLPASGKLLSFNWRREGRSNWSLIPERGSWASRATAASLVDTTWELSASMAAGSGIYSVTIGVVFVIGDTGVGTIGVVLQYQ